MAALRLSNSDRIRRDKLVGMLGSQFDGERLNALSMLQKMADSYKVPIHELLLDAGSGGAGSNFDRQRAEQAERKAREAELRAQRAEQAARKRNTPVLTNRLRTRQNSRRTGGTASQGRKNSIGRDAF